MAESLLVRDVEDRLVERREVLPGEPSGAEESFKEFAAWFRAQTAGRRHTPSLDLLRESRNER